MHNLNSVGILAIVPARGGSKGIVRKNLVQLAGMSLVARVADVIRALDWIDHAILTTDDEEIAEAGQSAGLDVPFIRPEALATDTAGATDVILHAWQESEEHFGCRFDFALYLEPTSPLRLPSDLETVMRKLIEGDYASVVTVSEIPSQFVPEKSLKVSSTGLVEFYSDEGATVTTRQGLPLYFSRNGVAYGFRRSVFFAKPEIIGSNTAAVVIDRPVANIDTEFDLRMAAWLLEQNAAEELR